MIAKLLIMTLQRGFLEAYKFFSSDKQKSKEYTHPTRKPVALLEYLINTYTNKDKSNT